MADMEFLSDTTAPPSRVSFSRITPIHWCVSLIAHAGLIAVLTFCVPRSGRPLGAGNGAGGGIDLTLIGTESGSTQEETPGGTEVTATSTGTDPTESDPTESGPAESDPPQEEPAEESAEAPAEEAPATVMTAETEPEATSEPESFEIESADFKAIEPQTRAVATLETPPEPLAADPAEEISRVPRASKVQRVSSSVAAVEPIRIRRFVEPAAMLSGTGDDVGQGQRLQRGAAASRFGAASNGAGTSFFGVTGIGTKFLYVVDCSGSMSHDNAFEAVRTELIASLRELDAKKQFQIVFYNLGVFPMENRDRRQPYFRATEINRELARQFINSRQPDDGTSHYPALKKALGMKPEVIFLLTHVDPHVDVPEMTVREIKEIQRLNGGRAQIHTIQFGSGELLDRDNFLMRLARENKGTHTYHDVAAFARDTAVE